jgi:hypothetical protein
MRDMRQLIAWATNQKGITEDILEQLFWAVKQGYGDLLRSIRSGGPLCPFLTTVGTQEGENREANGTGEGQVVVWMSGHDDEERAGS